MLSFLSPAAWRLAVFAAPVLLAACATARPSPVAPALAQRDVSAGGPGAVAWSPDGSTLAMIANEGVRLLDLRDGSSRLVSGRGAVAVDWAPGRALLVVERDGAGPRVVAVDPATSGRRVLHATPGLVAARWLQGGAGWMAVTASHEPRVYGATATTTIVAATGGEPSERYRWTVDLGPADAKADVGFGWAAARPHPVDHHLLLPQYRRAPARRSEFIELVSVDLFDPRPDLAGTLDPGRGTAVTAWSPDGARAVVAASDGKLVAVDWAPGRALLVIERDGAGPRVVAVDPATSSRRVLHAAAGLVAARWLQGGAGWMAVTASHEPRVYGAKATTTIVAATGGEPSERYRWTVELGPTDPDVGLGWAAARPHPIDHHLLLPQYRRAPARRSGNVELVSLDLFDPRPDLAGTLDLARGTALAAWSPDGARAVVAASDGELAVVERGEIAAVPTGPVRGLHPSWHPGGAAIFLGGWLVRPDGAPLEELVRGALDATGEWSPSGDRLAVVAGGRVFVFAVSTVAPPDAAAAQRRARARDSVWRLGTLSTQGLVGPDVYRERRDRQRARAQEKS
ncbi:MAG TPA: hypothetical protein VF875_00445 [Anaeromyxobacter sp.]